MKTTAIVGLLLSLGLLPTAHVYAQPSRTSQNEPAPPNLYQGQTPQTRTVHYGSQIFFADVATWTVLAATSQTDSKTLGALGVAGVLWGGPLVHLLHDNKPSAGLSFLARVGLPGIGSALGVATCDENRDQGFECVGRLFLGAMAGYAVALGVDWFYLAKKTEAVQPTGWASLRPYIVPTEGGATGNIAFIF